MTTLTITDGGRVTFKEVLKQGGLQPGDETRLDLLPHGRAQPTAEPRPTSWDDVMGCLEGKTNGAVQTIDEAGAQAGMRDS